MQEDNLMPRQGEYFGMTVPDDQTNAENKEKSEVTNELPVIDTVLKHLDKSIKFYSSVESISDDVLTNPDEFMHIVAANKLVVSILKTEKENLKTLVSEYK